VISRYRRNSRRETKQIVSLFFGICLVGIGCLSTGCSRKIENPPKVSIPGFKPSLFFSDEFETKNSKWQAEGVGNTSIEDGMLKVMVPPMSEGFVLWLDENIEKNFQVEYTLHLSDSSGTHGIYLCAEGESGENFLTNLAERTGKKEDYAQPGLRNYLILVHNVNREGVSMGWSRIRKNPHYYLLAHSDTDPCTVRRKYYMDLFKTGNRIQLYVDGVLIHDVKDKGGFGQPVYRNGIIGFRFDSLNKTADTRIDDLKIYQLNPI
jgi:hypothetical protein